VVVSLLLATISMHQRAPRSLPEERYSPIPIFQSLYLPTHVRSEHLPFISTPFLTLYTDGRVAPRSGLASKHSIDVGAGVIDADYRGPVKVLLFNLGETDFAINEGDRIAQLIIERVSYSARCLMNIADHGQIYTPEVLVVDQLPDSVRGAGGFGSTGGFANIIPPVNLPANGGASINGL
jgi:deoxyuridine 5'-triphosphate nucleotidohydrolase